MNTLTTFCDLRRYSNRAQALLPYRLFVLPAILSTLIVGTNLPTNAAETAIVEYGIFREEVTVADLSTLAETGEASSSLKAHLKTANKKPEDVQKTLNLNVDVDPVLLSKFLNHSFGEMLLDYVGEVIYTPSRRASRQALRGSLVTSALDDNNVKLIEVLENYPTSEVHLDGDRIAETFNRVQDVLKSLPNLPL